jgi:hypothetical protein
LDEARLLEKGKLFDWGFLLKGKCWREIAEGGK